LIAETAHSQVIRIGRLASEEQAVHESFYNSTLSDSESDALSEADPGLVRNEGNVCWYELWINDYLTDPDAYVQEDVFLNLTIGRLDDIDLYISAGKDKTTQLDAFKLTDTLPLAAEVDENGNPLPVAPFSYMFPLNTTSLVVLSAVPKNDRVVKDQWGAV
jgi:hypothetical protein